MLLCFGRVALTHSFKIGDRKPSALTFRRSLWWGIASEESIRFRGKFKNITRLGKFGYGIPQWGCAGPASPCEPIPLAEGVLLNGEPVRFTGHE